jgi:hypothetical protein
VEIGLHELKDEIDIFIVAGFKGLMQFDNIGV